MICDPSLLQAFTQDFYYIYITTIFKVLGLNSRTMKKNIEENTSWMTRSLNCISFIKILNCISFIKILEDSRFKKKKVYNFGRPKKLSHNVNIKSLMRTLVLPLVKVRTFILPIMKVSTLIMGKIKVRILILALFNVSEPSYCWIWMGGFGIFPVLVFCPLPLFLYPSPLLWPQRSVPFSSKFPEF